jgi:flavin-dependent dehydrogenase
MERFDVVVVGAGLAGLQCSRLLGQRGLRVLLVDQKPDLSRAIHTTGIFVRRTLEDFDLPASCLGPPVRHVRLYSPARRSMELVSPYDEFRVGRMGPLYQHFLNDCLQAGVRWRPGTKYSGHAVEKDELVVQLESGGRSRAVQARYLVAGDGAVSRVGRDLGLDTNREWIVGVEEVLSGVPLDGPPQLQCFLDPRLAPGYLAWVVHDGEETHVGVAGYPKRFDPLRALQEFRASLGDVLDLSGSRLIERRGGRIPVGGVLRRIAGEQGMLIGDAAGAVSPLTAGGLDPCMRLSTLAANVIAEYLEHNDARALDAYSGNSFRARFVSRLWMRRAAATVRNPHLLELGCAAMRLPLLKTFAWHVFFGRGSFPDVGSSRTERRTSVQASSVADHVIGIATSVEN